VGNACVHQHVLAGDAVAVVGGQEQGQARYVRGTQADFQALCIQNGGLGAGVAGQVGPETDPMLTMLPPPAHVSIQGLPWPAAATACTTCGAVVFTDSAKGHMRSTVPAMMAPTSGGNARRKVPECSSTIGADLPINRQHVAQRHRLADPYLYILVYQSKR